MMPHLNLSIQKLWFPRLFHRSSTGLNDLLIGCGNDGITSCRDEQVSNDAVRIFSTNLLSLKIVHGLCYLFFFTSQHH